MKIPNLGKFEGKIKEIPEIMGAFYTGSIAIGKNDKYSDIDMSVIVKSKDTEKIIEKLREIVSAFGNIKMYNLYSHAEGGWSFTSFIGQNYLEVEIDLYIFESMKPSLDLKNILIIKDRNSFLENLKRKSQKFKVEIPNIKDFKQLLFDIRVSQIYTARHTARGWKWSALGEVEYEGRRLFDVLTKLRGREQYGYREVEKWMTKKELAMLDATRCSSTKTEYIRKSMKAVWKFADYVKKEYERVTKRKIKLIYNDKEILKIANKTYDSLK